MREARADFDEECDADGRQTCADPVNRDSDSCTNYRTPTKRTVDILR